MCANSTRRRGCRRAGAWDDTGRLRADLDDRARVSPCGRAADRLSGDSAMSSKRGTWISQRGQAGADAAIDQVIDRQPQPGEQVQQIADALIEDSPYQARQAFSNES